MTLRQHDPSAHAPCTKIMVEFGGNPSVLETCEVAAARAVFCARANRVREPSRATLKDAAVSAPRNLRRSISSPRPDYLPSGNEQKAFVVKPFILLSAGRCHSRRRSPSSLPQFRPRVSQSQNVQYRGIAPSRSAGPFERPLLPRE